MFQLRQRGSYGQRVPEHGAEAGGKRVTGPHYCAGGGPGCVDARMSTISAIVGGRTVRAIIDTGCSTTVVSKAVVEPSKLDHVSESVQMMDGSEAKVRFRATVPIECSGKRIVCQVLVVPEVIGSRADMLLGMDAISQLGGVGVPSRGGTPKFGRVEHQAAVGMSDQPASVRVEDADFTVSFDGRCWTAAWKWKSDRAPPEMIRQPASYASAKQFEDEVDQELSDWKKNGWLIPFTGEPRAFCRSWQSNRRPWGRSDPFWITEQ